VALVARLLGAHGALGAADLGLGALVLALARSRQGGGLLGRGAPRRDDDVAGKSGDVRVDARVAGLVGRHRDQVSGAVTVFGQGDCPSWL